MTSTLVPEAYKSTGEADLEKVPGIFWPVRKVLTPLHSEITLSWKVVFQTAERKADVLQSVYKPPCLVFYIHPPGADDPAVASIPG